MFSHLLNFIKCCGKKDFTKLSNIIEENEVLIKKLYIKKVFQIGGTLPAEEAKDKITQVNQELQTMNKQVNRIKEINKKTKEFIDKIIELVNTVINSGQIEPKLQTIKEQLEEMKKILS